MTSAIALALLVIYALVAFGWRSLLQLRRTGSTGFKGFSGQPFSAEWAGGALFALALIMLPTAAVLDLFGVLAAEQLPFVYVVVGGALCALGFAGTVWSQFAMGDAWRIGVDTGETTNLVLRGPFRLVRNPIFSAMVVAVVGFVLLVPGAVSLVALGALVLGIELQVRLVEEPYLMRTHAEEYGFYAASVGRFVPSLGLIPNLTRRPGARPSAVNMHGSAGPARTGSRSPRS